jgi:TonB family protein
MKTMNLLLAHSFIVLLILGVIEAPTTAQNRPRPQSQETRTSNVQAVEVPEEKHETIPECEQSKRPKPKVELKIVSMLCGKAISLPKPPYPDEAKAMRVSGLVKVGVVIDENGRVIWAEAVGPPLLQDVSKKAACQARHSPTLISGRAVKIETSITYNFVGQ